jgi:hypothetical protein
METCSTCKYWGDSFPITPGKHNTCGKIGIDELPTKDTAFVDVQVADDTSLSVKFETLGTFGCNLHSSKQ